MPQMRSRDDAFGVRRAGLLDGQLQMCACLRYLNRLANGPASVAVDEQVDAWSDGLGHRVDCCDVLVDVTSAGFQLELRVACVLQVLSKCR